MPQYKLIYFNGAGLAELSRWILHYGDIPFTDERVEREDWPAMKSTIPGGKLPVLEVDGKMLPQSIAIARYLATKAGLVPQCPWHAAACDALVETLRDLIFEMFKIKLMSEKTEEDRQKELDEEYLPKMLQPILERLNTRMETKEWFVSDKITWADLSIGRTFDTLFKVFPEAGAKYPAVKSHAEKVQQLPKIKQWMEKRPKTPF